MPVEVEYLPVKDLRPYDRNPRDNNDSVDAVASSIKEFGFRSPIIINEDGVIIAGHTRLKAAKRLGLTEIPTIRAADLTDEQIKAYRIADNSCGEKSTWDDALLTSELADISMDMTPFGLTEKQEHEAERILDHDLKPFKKAFVLVACDVKLIPKVLKALEPCKKEGAEVDHVLN